MTVLFKCAKNKVPKPKMTEISFILRLSNLKELLAVVIHKVEAGLAKGNTCQLVNSFPYNAGNQHPEL